MKESATLRFVTVGPTNAFLILNRANGHLYQPHLQKRKRHAAVSKDLEVGAVLTCGALMALAPTLGKVLANGWFLPLSLLLGNHPWTTLFLETVLGGPKIIPNRRQECLFKEKRNLGSREESSFLSRRSRDRQQVTLFPSVPPPPPSSFPFEKERWEKMMEVGYEWWNLNDFLSRFLVSTT